MTNEEIYLNTVGKNYKHLQEVCQEVCKRNGEEYSEDILNDTVLSVHKLIQKKGTLDDMSESGIMNYFVRSYVNNLRMEKRYAYIKKRNDNIDSEELTELFEKSQTPINDKIIKDLLEDFSVLYIMKRVELEFPQEHYYLFKLKTLCNMTYKQIYDKTNIKKSRDKILEVKRWVKQNINRKIIKQEFFEIYGELFEN